MSYQRIGVAGAGAWGTALSLVASRAGRNVTLWARRQEQADALAKDRENKRYLPGFALPAALQVTNDLAQLTHCDAVILAVPAQQLRAFLGQALLHLRQEQPLIIAAKGIEVASGSLLSDVVLQAAPHNPLAVLSGPNFASEVAAELPAAATLAASNETLAHALVAALGTASFRPYASRDVLGVALGGAMKNVIAIAAGMVAGLKLGENARAALVTRGLAEMLRLGLALGAQPETLFGLSGLGDLVLTTGSAQSRNFQLGFALGEGKTLAEFRAGRITVAEGAPTASAALTLAARQGVELPITQAVNSVLIGKLSLKAAIEGLLARPFKAEFS